MLNNRVKKTSGRLLAVGDIHGCLKQLETLVRRVVPEEDDQFIFLGDYIDRGPDSAGVIDFLIQFGRDFPSTIFLRGNHEQMFGNYLEGHDPMTFLTNGGVQTLGSYRRADRWPIPSAHQLFLDSLTSFHETRGYIFVHAGLRPGLPLAEQQEHDLLWIRQEFIQSDYDWGKTVVYGHTPQQKPLLTPTRLGLDTGCVYGRELTCCEVRTRQIWQA